MGVLDTFSIPWTSSQLRALDMDVNTAVTAGAGSGKTQVLSARYLLAAERLLREGSDSGPDSILVLTFTEKAAAEMKERISTSILDYIRTSDFDRLEPRLQKRWIQFYNDLPLGEISTIHSFCARTLRHHPVEAGIDPEFSIIEGYEQNQMLDDAVRAVLSGLARDNDGHLETLLKMWSASRLIDVLKAVVINRDSLSGWLDRYSTCAAEDLERCQRAVIERFVLDVLSKLNTPDNEYLLRDIVEYSPQSDPRGDKLEVQRRLVSEHWRSCMSAASRGILDSKALSSLLEALCRGSGEPRSFGRLGSSSVWGKDGKEFIASRLEQLAEAVSARSHDLGLKFGEHDLLSIQILKALAVVGQIAANRFQEMKNRSGVLDFTDLEIKARDLLRSQSLVRQFLAGRYRYVMVDEFQDTNATQWEIIRCLCRDARNQEFANGKLFLVGDEKQAIYSFRGGDVTTFASARRELAGGRDIDETCTYRKVVFEDNFRSCQQLVDFFNFVFSRILGSGDLPDYEAEFQQMVKANRDITQQGWAQVHLVDVPREVNHLAVEAEVVAGLAAEMASDITVKSFAKDQMPLVAILLRRMSNVKVYEAALRKRDIEFSTVKGRGFYQQQEILDIFNLLAFLSDERRDIELFGVLRSPIFALSDEEIVAIMSSGKGTMWERLCRSTLPEASRCRQMLKRWLGLKDRCAIGWFIRHVLVDSGFYAPLAYGRRGRQRLANVEKMISLARSFGSGGKSLAEFVTFLESQMAGEEAEGEADVAIESPVVLMTIHQAKGLQFPAVIVPDLAGRFNMGFDASVYIGEVEGQSEVGISAPDPSRQGAPGRTALRWLIQSSRRCRELAEQKRLLYVAATRAQLLLAMVGKAPEKPVGERDYEELDCWSEWLVKACALESIDSDTLVWESHQHLAMQSSRTQIGPLTAVIHRLDLRETHLEGEATGRSASEAAIAVSEEQVPSLAQGNRHVREQLSVLDKLAAVESASGREAGRGRSRRLVELSATAVMDYVRCPRLFYLRNRIGVPEQLLDSAVDPSIEPGNLDATMGAKVGDLFHRLIAQEIYDPDDDRIEAVARSLLPVSDLRLLDSYVATARRHLTGFDSLGYPARIRSLPEGLRRCELGLDLVIEETEQLVVRFTGFIDMLMAVGQGVWRILDFKTNALRGQDVDEFTRGHLYDLQMELYMAIAGLALCRAGRDDTIDKAEIVYTSVGKSLEVYPRPDTVDRLVEIAHRIAAEEFPSEIRDTCDKCVYRVLCHA